MLKMNHTRKKFKQLFRNMSENVEEIIELQLDCVEDRMTLLDDEERYKDLIALGQEYMEWANTEDGEEYGFFYAERLCDNII
jgi:hypothetical protein